MGSDSETVADIVKQLRDAPLAENGAKAWPHCLADRIEAEHRREILVERKLADDHLAAKNAEAERLRRRLKISEDALKAVRRLTRNTDLPITASQAACAEATKALDAIREEEVKNESE